MYIVPSIYIIPFPSIVVRRNLSVVVAVPAPPCPPQNSARIAARNEHYRIQMKTYTSFRGNVSTCDEKVEWD